MRQHLNDEHRAIFDQHLRAAVTGGCDLRQAEQIAKERTLKIIMRNSAAIAYVRAKLNSDINQQPSRAFGFSESYD